MTSPHSAMPPADLFKTVCDYLTDKTPNIQDNRGLHVARLFRNAALSAEQRSALVGSLENIYEHAISNFVLSAEVHSADPERVRNIIWLCDAVADAKPAELDEKAVVFLKVLSNGFPHTEPMLAAALSAAAFYITHDTVHVCKGLFDKPTTCALATALMVIWGDPEEALKQLHALCLLQFAEGWGVDVALPLADALTRMGLHNVMRAVICPLGDYRLMLRAHLTLRWGDEPTLAPLLPHL
ncbi:MAG: hypothetical protein GC134_01445 [Proteobacteria bacterium]|nr:hypothetical protein [Pseudomonadota bacterium]